MVTILRLGEMRGYTYIERLVGLPMTERQAVTQRARRWKLYEWVVGDPKKSGVCRWLGTRGEDAVD